MADRIYTREDLQKYLDDQKTYLFDTTKSEDFANLHEAAIKDIEAFINGELSITPDAYDKMSDFIDIFAKYQKDAKMMALYDRAIAKLNSIKSKAKDQTLKAQMPDLTKLNVPMPTSPDKPYMRESSETAAILEDELKAIENPDTRFSFIFGKIIEAYRTGDGIETLNDEIKTESDIKVAEAAKRAVEHDNAGTVPMIEKEVIRSVDPQEEKEDKTKGKTEERTEEKTEEVIDLLSLDGKYKDRISVAEAFENWDWGSETNSMREVALALRIENKQERTTKLQELQDQITLTQSEEAQRVMDDNGYMFDLTTRPVVVGPDDGGNDDGGNNDGGNDDGGNDDEYEVVYIPNYTTKAFRRRQADNFDNIIAMNLIELEVLYKEGKITETQLNEASVIFKQLDTVGNTAALSPSYEAGLSANMVSAEDERKAYDLIESARATMKPKALKVHKAAIIDNLCEKMQTHPIDRYKQLLTPEIISEGISLFETRAQNNSLSEEDKKENAQRLQTFVNVGNNYVSDIEKSQGYYISDITNAADEYDGYTHLIKTLSSKEEYKDKNINYEAAQQEMDKYVAPYRELYKIPAVITHPVHTAERLVGRLNGAIPVLDNLEFSEQTLGKDFMDAAANFKFATEYDAEGRPIAFEECIKDGKVVEGSSLETLLKFAANDVMLQKLNTGEKITAELLLEGTKDQAYTTMFAYANSEETIQKGLKEDIDKFENPKYRNAFIASLKDNQATVLSPLAVKLAQNREANKVETFANRLKSQLGAQNTRYIEPKLIAQVSKIDKTSHFKDNTDIIKKKALRRQIGGVAISGVAAYGISRLSTKLAAKYGIGALTANTLAAGGAISLGAELAVGTPKAVIYALGGAAASTIVYFAFKKVSAKINKQKYGFKEMKADMKTPQFATAIIAGSLSGASLGYALSGCPKMAVTCGYAALGTAAAGRAISSYRDMRLSGHKKGAAIALAALNAAIVPVAGHLGRLHAMHGQTPQSATEVADEATTKDFYQHGKPADWTEDPTAGPGNGYLVDYKNVGPYHNYEADAMTHSVNRSDGIRFSEFLNQGKGGLHVQPDYQNGLGGLMHDATLHDNAIDALNRAAATSGHEWMNTFDSSTGAVTSNSEILFYKLYQQAVLHPKDPQIMGTFKDLLQGKLDPTGLGVIERIENDTSSLGHVLSDHNSFSYKTEIDPGYTPVFDKLSVWARYTREHVLQPLSALGAVMFEGVRKVTDKLRPARRADLEVKEEVQDGVTKVVRKKDPKPRPTPDPKKPYEAPTTKVLDNPTPTPTPDPKQPYEAPETMVVSSPLADEYKIVHGIEPNKSEFVRYKTLVTKEYREDKEQGKTKAETFDAYVQERVDNFNNTYGDKATERANTTRETMWKTNLAYQGKKLQSSEITMRHFAILAGVSKKAGAYNEVTAAHDTKRAPTARGKHNKPREGTLELTTLTTSGQTKNKGKGQHTHGLPKVDSRS